MLAKCVLILFVILFSVATFAQEVVEPTPADVADKAARSPGGKLVRIVGAHYDREAIPVTDTWVM